MKCECGWQGTVDQLERKMWCSLCPECRVVLIEHGDGYRKKRPNEWTEAWEAGVPPETTKCNCVWCQDVRAGKPSVRTVACFCGCQEPSFAEAIKVKDPNPAKRVSVLWPFVY